MAQLIQVEIGRTGGVEGTLESTGRFLVYVSIMALLFCIYLGGEVTKTNSWDEWSENGYDFAYLIIGCAGLIGAIVFLNVLKGMSEIIRLLKYNNDLPICGELTEGYPIVRYYCPRCDKEHRNKVEQCCECGATFANRD